MKRFIAIILLSPLVALGQPLSNSFNAIIAGTVNATTNFVGEGGGITLANDATNSVQAVRLSQLQNLLPSSTTYYLYGSSNAYAATFGVGTTANTNYCYNVPSSGSANTMTVNGVTTGEYLVSYVTADTFKAIGAGSINVDFYASFNSGAGRACSLVAEIYVLDTVANSLVVEYGTPVAQTITGSSANYVFTVAATNYTSANPLRLVAKIKVATQANNPNVSIVTENGQASHIDFNIPSSSFVLKSGDTMTGALIGTSSTMTTVNDATVNAGALNVTNTATIATEAVATGTYGTSTFTNAPTIKATGLSINGVSLTFPSTNAVANQLLRNDGSGNLTWTNPPSASGGSVQETNLLTGYVYKTANYTILATDDMVEANAVGGAFALTLPDATSVGGRTFKLKKVDASDNAVTVTCNGTQTIDDIGGYALTVPNQQLVLVSNGTNWLIRSFSLPYLGSGENLDIGLRKWRAALAQDLTTNLVNVVCIGDSITEGYNATDRINGSFPGLLRTNLQNLYGGSGYGLVGNWRQAGADYGPYNVTFSNSWSFGEAAAGNGGGAFAKVAYATGTNFTASLTNISCASYDVIYAQNIYTGSGADFIEVDVNGVLDDSWSTTTDTPTTYHVRHKATTVSTGTITVKAPKSNYLFFHGFVLHGAATPVGIEVHNLGFNGKSIASYVGSNPGTNVLWLGALSPALTIIDMDTNDYAAQTALATFESYWSTVITNAVTYGSVLIMGAETRNSSLTIAQRSYQNVLRKLASQNGCAFISTMDRWGSNTEQNALGLCTDGIHPTDKGHSEIRNTLLKILRAY